MIHGDLHINALRRDDVEAHADARSVENAPLGNNTNTYSADIEKTANSRVFRAKRYALKSVVNEILPDSRTAKCMRWRAPKSEVEVWRGMSAGIAGKAFFKGLYVCGRLWTCPVCAAKISERRRLELSVALENAKEQGLKVFLITQTIKHGVKDDLKVLLEKIANAEKRMWSNRDGMFYKKWLGVVGTIKTTEVLWGSNGWHPHKHTLLFLNKDMSSRSVFNALSSLWIDSCVKAGLPAPTIAHGLTVQDGSYASDYVSKWGLESEMTKGHSKVGKKGGLTPFALLDDVLETGNAQSWELFKVYADAFHRRKQLVWSHGLRAKLLPNVDERTDEQLASDEDIDVRAVVWASLSVLEWRAVKFYKYESTLLDKCEDLTPDAVQSWLDSVSGAYAEICNKPKRETGGTRPARGNRRAAKADDS